MIEITKGLLEEWPLPQPEAGGDKEARGRLLIVAGAAEMPGTAVLAGLAALRAGAGKIQIATPAGAAPMVASALLEGRVFALPETKRGGISPEAADLLLKKAQPADALLIGPGLVDKEAIGKLLIKLLPELGDKPLILDAGALTALGEERNMPRLSDQTLITPHAGEMAKLLGQESTSIREDPQAATEAACKQIGGNTVLKGRETYIRQADGKLFCNRAGDIGLATAGSGDVLAGLMGGLLARGASPGQAAIWAVFVHAKAGERLAERIGQLGFLARELSPEFPSLLETL